MTLTLPCQLPDGGPKITRAREKTPITRCFQRLYKTVCLARTSNLGNLDSSVVTLDDLVVGMFHK